MRLVTILVQWANLSESFMVNGILNSALGPTLLPTLETSMLVIAILYGTTSTSKQSIFQHLQQWKTTL